MLVERLKEASSFIVEQLNFSHAEKSKTKIGIVLGSGLSPLIDVLLKAKSRSLAYSSIPHFGITSVEGHKGELFYGEIASNINAIILSGRLHAYEGYSPEQVIFPIRVLKFLGVETVILTNASGAINDAFSAGELMVITDHINLTGKNPLTGKNIAELGPRFVDMSEAYDRQLLNKALCAATEQKITLHQGIYMGISGPCYETPAEIRMFKSLGADAVGMSTVFETIAARHMGMRVLAISCLANKAAGLSQKTICHEEVFDVAQKMSQKLGSLLKQIAIIFKTPIY